jgi:hypothetical protein
MTPVPPTADVQYIRFVVTAHCEALRQGANLKDATWASTRGTVRRYPAQSRAVGAQTELGKLLTRRISNGIMEQCGFLQKEAVRRSWSFD